MNCLLIDFGASRVKSAILHLKTAKVSNVTDFSTPANCNCDKGYFEISPLCIKKQFRKICNYYFNILKIEFGEIFICSQMHGAILMDEKKKTPMTNYISWRDERSLEKIKGIETFSILDQEIAAEFKEITGMKLRPGLPFSNIMHLARKNKITKTFRILTLPEYLSVIDKNCLNRVHDSMLASTGFYDIRKKRVSKDLLAFFKSFTKHTPCFNDVTFTESVSGYIRLGLKRIPIFTGVGDFQCAVLGAGNKADKTISVNIGTGSQVSVISRELVSGNYELRPYFRGQYLKAITHIPAGRVLQKFIELIAYTDDEKRKFWDELGKINLLQIRKATLSFDLNIFHSSWLYSKGGGISNIHEEDFTRHNYLASLLSSFISQYCEAIDLLDTKSDFHPIIISGGVIRKLPNLSLILGKMTHKKVVVNKKDEESIIGLKSLALAANRKELM